MKNSELFLKCAEIAARPIKGISYNLESLISVAESIFVDNIPVHDKIQKLMDLFADSGNSIEANIPIKYSGRKKSFGELATPIERSLPINKVLEVAEEIYLAAISKDCGGLQIYELGLSVRALNFLESKNISTVDEIVNLSGDKIIEYRKAYSKSIDEISLSLSIKFGIKWPKK